MLVPRLIVPFVASENTRPAGVAVNVPVTGPAVTLLTPIVALPVLQNAPPVNVSFGNGLTVIVKLVGVPGQLTPPAV